MKLHPYAPAHMTRTSFGNVPACCELPEGKHPAFVDGTETTVVLTHDVRTLKNRVVPKGTVIAARRNNRPDALQEVRPSRWGSIPDGPYKGTFAELDKGEYVMVASPGWTIRLPGDDHLTGIPWKWAREA